MLPWLLNAKHPKVRRPDMIAARVSLQYYFNIDRTLESRCAIVWPQPGQTGNKVMHYSHSAAEHAADMYGTPIARTVFGFDSFLGLPQDDPAAHESFKGRCARPGEERRLEQPRSSPGAEEQGPPHLLLLTFSSCSTTSCSFASPLTRTGEASMRISSTPA